jgi:adenine/guanine phosphoribosyltransferase-like PRPP-binding protein
MTNWVEAQFGVQVSGDASVPDLVALALRRNPRRAHLLVSTVLGKHLPADPRVVHGTGLELGRRVAKLLDGRSALVLGFAETATGLGHCVAEALDAEYLHTTRRSVPGAVAALAFEEEHSHATTHRLLPARVEQLARGEVLVLVDDELSTGRTAMNAIRMLHAQHRRTRYVLAALVDLRGAADRAALDTFAAQLGVSIDVVSLGAGSLGLPSGFADTAAAFVAGEAPTPREDDQPSGELITHPLTWPSRVREGGRHGFAPIDVHAAHAAAAAVAAEIASRCGERVLVLGTEELMYAPTLIALHLAELVPEVRVSSTTRSPVFALDAPGYPIRTALSFPSHDSPLDGPGTRFAYNVGPGLDDIVVVVDTEANTPQLHAGLLAELRSAAHRVQLVVVPCHRPLPVPLCGPEFGSYPRRDVAWLLTDLSDVRLEAPVEEREEAIQSGGAHYAESLPIEYQPDAEYRALFEQALDEAAGRIAHAVGVVTEIVLAERGPTPVLASLARAGTPVGVLLRRWAQYAHGLELPHYAVSIVRGRGIDTNALRYLAARFDPSDVVFVDGWTGKGAIARELTAAIASANAELRADFVADLAVLADPGSCVTTFGTRDDFLIPSACLNSTVSGLVSRTVLNATLLPPGGYHGAKFYRELASSDVSMRFVDAVVERFPDVAGAVARDWSAAQTADRTPTWRGWADVEAVAAQYGIDNLNLVKPGVGETTRVLLRRVPELVLARAGAGRELDHVRLLAAQRDVPVREVPELGFSCIGIVRTLRP